MPRIELTLTLTIEVDDESALRDAGFKAMRRRSPGEDGVRSATITGDNSAAALAAYVASVPRSIGLSAPGVSGLGVKTAKAQLAKESKDSTDSKDPTGSDGSDGEDNPHSEDGSTA